jgi:hypothetical protein
MHKKKDTPSHDLAFLSTFYKKALMKWVVPLHIGQRFVVSEVEAFHQLEGANVPNFSPNL